MIMLLLHKTLSCSQTTPKTLLAGLVKPRKSPCVKKLGAASRNYSWLLGAEGNPQLRLNKTRTLSPKTAKK